MNGLFRTISCNRTWAIIAVTWVTFIFALNYPASIIVFCYDKPCRYIDSLPIEFAAMDMPRLLIFILIMQPVGYFNTLDGFKALPTEPASLILAALGLFALMTSIAITAYVYMYIGVKTQRLIQGLVRKLAGHLR